MLLFSLLQTGGQIDIWSLVVEASIVVQAVMILLVLMSVMCWFIMGAKFGRLRQADRKTDGFLRRFWEGEGGGSWSAERLEGIYAGMNKYANAPVAKMFKAGYIELARVGSDPTGGDLANIERTLRRSKNDELTRLESYVPFLATTGSTAPFVGLFGTVWGIMNAFLNLKSGEGQATLDAVAPGIAEALIATAIGLAAAIPAVMAYNYFVRKLQVLESEMEAFSTDFLNIVRRNFLKV